MRPSAAAEEVSVVLETFGGFPEPFLRQDLRLARRWRRERLERLFREDVRALSMVQDLVTMQRLAELLPERESAVVSANALAEDLNIHSRTAANWLDILESLYHIFRLTPWMSRQAASVRKERKLYFWDWAEQADPARRLENLVASHLLKFRDFLAEDQGYDMGLHFLCAPRGREVDFLVCLDRRPWFAVEVKMSETEPAGPLLRFRERLGIPFCYQVVARSGVDHVRSGVRVLAALV